MGNLSQSLRYSIMFRSLYKLFQIHTINMN
nr:MAG TPA: hypothetical protein [Caudoviricetes sp.]DAR92374.1 MAG TPA: hypothetical protein [Caudoviricetes sp.]DAX86805.1 MAG TPA: hypothetical protein [Caudoviricetes sp.]